MVARTRDRASLLLHCECDLVKGSREIAEALAARPDVARVEGNPRIQNVLPQPDGVVEASSQPQTRYES